ncbi:sugar transferase [Pacificibacter sp.]|uniref:sugar transferase n=1 Tax=Pacificibacter sp. TaxID=1917866 RepID=UPI0032191765
MTYSKRVFDFTCALILTVLLSPALLVVSVLILCLDGRPVFYVSERMQTPTRGFQLLKFRTMKPVSQDAGVSGGDKSGRITRTGAFLRGKRIDEIPQLWNVLKGDISFVGPRPPLRQYVERFPEVYGPLLRSRPGVTGLASVYFSKHEEHLLASTQDSEETDAIYCRQCIPRKAKLDMIYQSKRSLCFDCLIMLHTVFKRRR